MALLSSSPLLASLFISYANQAAALEPFTPSTESEEWKALENTIFLLQEEVDKLKPKNLEMMEKLEAAAASQEAFRSQVTSLKEVNAAQQQDIDSLRAELLESKDKCNRLVEDSNVERDVLQSVVSNLKAREADLKETVVKQQLELSKLDRQDHGGPPNSPIVATITDGHKLSTSTAQVMGNGIVKKEAKEKTDCDNKAREEEERKKLAASKPPPAWGSTIGKNKDRSWGTPGLLHKEKSVWDKDLVLSSTEDESFGLPTVITSSVPGVISDGTNNLDFLTVKVPPGDSAEEEVFDWGIPTKKKKGRK